MAPPLARRMACWVYDGVLLFGVMFAAGLLFLLLMRTLGAQEDHLHALQAFLFVVAGVYLGWCWSRGQTLAMKTWRIRIAGRAGRPPGLAHALLRYALSWLWFAPPLALAWFWHLPAGLAAALAALWIILWALASRLHPQRQFWHDAWAGTRLVDGRQ
jgi:uncharacterized RDD family membrane protein YckC